MNEAKPFVVEKWVVMESWLQVKANRGSAGIDGIDLKSYEGNLPQIRFVSLSILTITFPYPADIV